MEPALPRSIGFGPFATPPFWPAQWYYRGWPGTRRSGRRLRGDPAAPGSGAARRQPATIAQVPPAGHAAATAHLLGQQLPADAALKDVYNASQAGAVGDAGAALGLGWLWRQQRRDDRPQLVTHRRPGMTFPADTTRQGGFHCFVRRSKLFNDGERAADDAGVPAVAHRGKRWHGSRSGQPAPS